MSDLPEDDACDAPSSGSTVTQGPPDYDGAWKNALDAYFPDFLALLWPTLHAQIDWTHKPVFLDKELQRLAASSHHHAVPAQLLQSPVQPIATRAGLIAER